MKVLEEVQAAIDAELIRAQAKFPAFNSAHEGYAVILEEVEEHAEEQDGIARALGFVWQSVRRNDLLGARGGVEGIVLHAQAAAAEAIQVAAMSRRFLADLPAEETT